MISVVFAGGKNLGTKLSIIRYQFSSKLSMLPKAIFSKPASFAVSALAVFLLGGCISSKRMTDISPLGEKDEPKMSEKRVNAWPLYYATGAGGVSVLWPFMDFDDNGWAFRPFYVKDGDEFPRFGRFPAGIPTAVGC
ncbi:MAG: hypothetical protein J6L64_08220 [Opitutales bacterium]|nr:hypothetical protein [Opitutales bacterium]